MTEPFSLDDNRESVPFASDSSGGQSRANKLSRRDLLRSGTLLGMMGLAGCPEGDQSAGTETAMDETETAMDDGPTLESSAGTPGTVVTVSGLGDAFGGEPQAWLYDASVDDPNEDDRHPAFVDGERDRLVVPVHPADYIGGGPAEIEIVSEDEQVRSPGIEFEVLPLEPAPGTLVGIVDDLERACEEGATAFGYDPGEIRNRVPTTLPPPVNAIAAVLRAIDGDDFGDSFRAVLAGRSSMFDDDQFSEDGRAVVDAVLADSDLPDQVSTAVSPLSNVDLPGLGDGQGSLGQDSAASSTLLSSGAVGSGSGAQGARQTDDQQAEDASLDISDPASLDQHMTVQERFNEANTGAASAARNLGEVVVAGTAFVPGGQAPATIGSGILFLMSWIIEMGDGQLPSELDQFEIRGDPTDYNEDEDRVGEWEASITARSTGFEWSWPQTIGAMPGAGKLSKAIGKLGSQVQIAARFSKDFLEFAQTTTTFAWGHAEDAGPLDFPPSIFGPVDVDPGRENEREYFTWELDAREADQGTVQNGAVDGGPAPFVLLGDGARYEPQAAGWSRLTLQTAGKSFNDQHRITTLDLEVEPVEVDIEDGTTGEQGAIYRIDTEQDPTLSLSAVVTNAADPSVEWTIETEAGPALPEPTPLGPHGETIELDASSVDFTEYDTAVYRVEAESTTEAGLREGREPPRTDDVRVLVTEEELELDVSAPQCVGLADTYQFDVRLAGEPIDFDDLSWTVDGPGSVRTGGEFEPSGQGDVTVEFEYEAEFDEILTESVNFEVTDNCAYFRMSGGGFSLEDDCPSYTSNDSVYDGVTNVTLRADGTQSGSDLGFTVDIAFGFEEHDKDRHRIRVGEWTTQVTPGFPLGLLWFDITLKNPGRQLPDRWENRKDDSYPPHCEAGPCDRQLTIRQTEREIDGETVAFLSGEFSGSVYHAVQSDSDSGYRYRYERTTVSGEFAGAYPSDRVYPEQNCDEFVYR